MALPHAVARAVVRECAALAREPCEGIRVSLSEDCLREVHAEIDGPAGTPYEGGNFRMKVRVERTAAAGQGDGATPTAAPLGGTKRL